MLSWPIDWSSALGIHVMGELAMLANDLGGWEQLSRQKQILVEKTVFLQIQTTQYEAALLEGKPLPFSHGTYFNKSNLLLGLLKALKLERQSKTVSALDYTPEPDSFEPAA